MPAKGAQTAGQRAFGLRLALFNRLAGLESRSAQLHLKLPMLEEENARLVNPQVEELY
jgi:hypothetical protein